MRSGGLYFRFFHYTLLICLLVGSVLFGYALITIYRPDLMAPGIAWYYFGLQPGLVLFPLIGLAIFGILSSIYKYGGVLLMTVFIACAGMTFFVLNS
ncbi:hypothetical protein [Providencia sp. PROV255]|uniref:hypothetical protein n=1 Tax=Providencia sp. PROV255 TaxID=2949943 RepID=UPI00234A7A27|nr:hypothetical protein [Providencia sp. PROV255]